jgi:DNA/RNA endonuclease YhcR with UshA esterase domain
MPMKPWILVFGFCVAAVPALAEPVPPIEAPSYVGATVTVEGVVNDVFTDRRSGTTFIDIGGAYPNEAFAGVIFGDAASEFPNVTSLNGKTVDVTGEIRLYRGRPEVILETSDQVKSR